MGVFTRDTASKADGEKMTISKPSGLRGIKKLYISSSNLTHAQIKCKNHINDVAKSVSTNYMEGFWPLGQLTDDTVDIIIYGPGSAETITVIVEWE